MKRIEDAIVEVVNKARKRNKIEIKEAELGESDCMKGTSEQPNPVESKTEGVFADDRND